MKQSGFQFVPAPKQRLADILYGQLLEQILSGALVPGDKLPTENEICTSFQVSRTVVREALMRLQADGLVQSRRGSGTYLLRAPSQDSQRHFRPEDFARLLRGLEVRLALEPRAAQYAAERHTKAQLAEIKSAAAAFERGLQFRQPGEDADIAFHRAIARASGNELFATQFDSIVTEIAGFISATLGLTREGTDERREAVQSEHRRIVSAIEAGDGMVASAYMQFHLLQARQRLTERTSASMAGERAGPDASGPLDDAALIS